jgi:YVTN family beta-propeller protein
MFLKQPDSFRCDASSYAINRRAPKQMTPDRTTFLSEHALSPGWFKLTGGRQESAKGPQTRLRSDRVFPLRSTLASLAVAAASASAILGGGAEAASNARPLLSPVALASTKDEKTLLIATASSNRILRFDIASRKNLDFISVPEAPSGLAVSPGGHLIVTTTSVSESDVSIIDLRDLSVTAIPRAGHGAAAPVFSPDGRTLYACNRFDNEVSVFDLASRSKKGRIPVPSEPVAAAVTTDGNCLLVANFLHAGRANTAYVSAVVSVIDLAAGEVVKELSLPNGSGSLREIRVSPDGRYAAVTHLVARFNRPATRLHYGWMNVNALTIIDLSRIEIFNTVLLDSPESGAANPWGLAWSADSSTLVVTHAGTHEISVIDFPVLMKHLQDIRTLFAADTNPSALFKTHPEAADDLPSVGGARKRIKLPASDLGPRAVVVVGRKAYVANYFSDTLTIIDLSSSVSIPESIPLTTEDRATLSTKRQTRAEVLARMDPVRRGEFYFHDGTICLEGWQSCSSCHPDSRADGLNWDLPNDGLGNPKNTKSLLLSHQTSPAMWLGVRETAEAAVRSGIRNILFTKQPEQVAADIDAYLKSLKPVPSPHLVYPKSAPDAPPGPPKRPPGDSDGVGTAERRHPANERPLAVGELSPPAKRGEILFTRAGCAGCHPAPLFTNRHQYDVGTRGPTDNPTDKFDTPTLIELWRTAPYLHDGSAITVREIMTTRNPHDAHGTTSILTSEEIDDLCAYVLSL